MANRFAKKTIDFDVYERQDKESQINWGKVGADITKAFSDVATERQAKKDAIQKSFNDQQAAAADMGEYNDVTIQQYAINGGQKIANYNQDMYNLVQKGIIKPSEYTKFTNNVTANLKLVKANAKSYDDAFKLYTDRTQNNENAALERYQAGMLEGFASLNNLELDWDPMTGEAVNIRVDADGNPIPGESMTVQNMSVMLKQQYNAYDLDGSIKTVKDRLGSVITADLKASLGNSVVITEEMVTKAEQDFFDPKNKRGQDVLRKEALAVLTDDVGKQDLLAENSAILTEKGEKYRVGSLEEYEQWNEENPGDEKNNPILRTKFEGGRLVPEFNEFQDEAATNYMMGMISNSLDVKQTKESKNLPFAPQESKASIDAGKAKEIGKGAFTTLRTFITGTGADAKAAGDELAIMYNKNVKEGERKMRRIDRMTNGQFRVIYTEGDDDLLGDPDGSVKNAERALYAVIQAGTDMPQLYDSALKEFDLSAAEGNVTLNDPLSGFTQQAESTYTPGLVAVLEDGKYVNKKLSEVSKSITTENWLGNASDPKKLVTDFTELINTPGFLPATFKTDLKRIGQAVEMYTNANGDAEFRIVDRKTGKTVQSGGEDLVITMNDTFLEDNANTGVSIATQIQEMIKKKNADVNKRFNRSDKNFPPYKEWIKQNQGKSYTDYLNAKRA